MRTQLLVAVLALVGAARLTGQDRRAEILGAGMVARYPEVLQAAGIVGIVRLRVLVVPGDSVPLVGITVLSSPHPGFTRAARETAHQFLVRAAVRGGNPVVDSLEVALEYAQGPGSGFPPLVDTSVMEGLARDSTGLWRARIANLALKHSLIPLDPSIRDSAVIAAVRNVASQGTRVAGGGAPVVCVALREGGGAGALSPAEWQAVQLPGIAMLHPARCPPKFASMLLVEGRVNPPGQDPFHLVVTGVEGMEGGWVVIHIALGQGTGGDLYDCAVRSSAPTQVVRCQSNWSWVS